ncbi:MAG: S-layer homology domain-containing protein [Oscillospiraceae bacterium]|nr:S-layer homology domain-containing protein [Oscillospiraceae bacterium]
MKRNSLALLLIVALCLSLCIPVIADVDYPNSDKVDQSTLTLSGEYAGGWVTISNVSDTNLAANATYNGFVAEFTSEEKYSVIMPFQATTDENSGFVDYEIPTEVNLDFDGGKVFVVFLIDDMSKIIAQGQIEDVTPTPPRPSPRPGSGSGGSATTTTLRKAATSNGSFDVSPSDPKAGDTVTITPHPNAGYEVDTVTVKDSAGNTISVTKNANGTYTFTMPSSNLPVTVTVTFKAVEKSIDFTDVPSDAWYADAVKWAVENGITQGKGNNLFAPNDTCTRAEAVTFLYRAAGQPEVSYDGSFSDVASGEWYTNAVAWAVANGITQGKGDGKFAPNDTCTRAEIVTFMARFAKAGDTAPTTQFTDVAATDYFAGSVAWAVQNGITQGKNTSTTFVPNDSCTRAEIVTFLYRYFVK